MFGLMRELITTMNDFKEAIENIAFIKQLDELFENEEIDEQTFEDSKNMIFDSLGENIDNLNIYKIKLESKIRECQEIEKRYYELRKHYNKKLENLNKFLLSVMDNLKTDKLIGNVGYIKRRQNKFVNIYDLDKIPDKYKKTEIITTPIKSDIKKAIEEGEYIEGASIGINNSITYK